MKAESPVTPPGNHTPFDPSDKSWGHCSIRSSEMDLPRLKFDFLRNGIDGQGGRVLEVGCSGARHLSALQTLDSSRAYVGCDIDVDSILNGKQAHPKISFVAADGMRLPFEDEAFDATYCMDYLEHVEDPRQAVSEMARILKKGGVLSAFVPCEGNGWTLYHAFSKIFGFNVKRPAAGHIQSFTDRQIIALFRQQGLKVTRVRYSYHLLGHAGDFVLFLLVHLNKKVANLWWAENKYYHEEPQRPKSLLVRAFNALLSTANFSAYLESKALHRIRFLSAGIHVNCRKP